MERLRLAGAQINPVVGDVDGNVGRLLDAYRDAVAAQAHLVVFPELAVTGYPPEDLVFKPSFLAASRAAVERVAAETGEVAAVVGYVEPTHAGPANAAALCHRGRVLASYRKVLLPNYGVFDEERYFVPGGEALLACFGAAEVAVTICEDVWFPWGPVAPAAAAGAEVVVCLNASPYRIEKRDRLMPMLATRAADHGVHLFYVHAVGGQDELVYPGEPLPPRVAPALATDELVYRALVTATRDYVTKNGFDRVFVGLSGGIDSSLVAVIAAEPVDAFMAVLKEPFAGTEPGVAEENVQARARGTLLMSLSNKFGGLVLATGNKSELAVGYATLYGDMAGGFAVIRDVPKTLVYRLARWRNQLGVVIPQSVLDKPPSAELRPGQRDTDSLPPYEVLDPILERYIEDDASAEEIVALGFDPDTVARVVRMVDGAEYKRRQAA